LNLLPSSIKPAFGGALLPAFRDEASSMWPGRHRDANHFVGCSHFQIERLCNLGLEPRDVVVPDVPAILPQMCGDAVGTGFNRDLRCMDGVGVPAPARVAHRCDVIDVDTKPEIRNGHNAVRLPREQKFQCLHDQPGTPDIAFMRSPVLHSPPRPLPAAGR
jgi:hypothetical protein